jgi:OmpA-OmpF porin, OOP family
LRPFSERSENRFRLLSFSVGSLVLASASFVGTARAQTVVEPDFSVQRLHPALGPRNFIVTRGARTDGTMTFSAGVLAHYGYKPLVVRTCVTDEGESCESPGARNFPDIQVIENMITADVMGTLTPMPQLQLGLRVPVTWVRGQGINEDGTNTEEALSAVGIGDPELEVKFRAYGDVNAPFVLGVAAFATAPLGEVTAEDKYIGDKSPTFGGRVIIDGQRAGFGYAVNLGGAYRNEATVGSAMMGAEARYSAGVGYQVSPVFRPMVDVFGSTRFTSTSGENALEALGAVQIQPRGTPVAIVVGAGTTLIEGVGVPNVRALLGVTWIAESKDGDGDGIDDKIDQCPTEPEDKDGYEDSDGCPDRDNDLDSIADSADKCPSQPEDMDGFEDTDGCPELDNDKDGFPDTGDQCPAEAETKNNYKDEDGCPDESDVDNDGVPDSRDKCPNEPEDTDGFEDTDGCPDPDNDKDGVLDDQDECIDEPETVNEFQDTDGCPDEAQGPKKRR